jgi:hypothetical protein
MKIIDDNLIYGVVEQAKLSPRLRMNSVRIVEPMVLTSQKTFGTDWSAWSPVYFSSAKKAHS